MSFFKATKELNFTLLMKELRVDEVISEEYSEIQNAFIDEINVLLESSYLNLTSNQELDEL